MILDDAASDIARAFGSTIVTALVSFLAAAGMFRFQLSAHARQVERDREHDKELLKKDFDAMTKTLASIESRSRISLEIVAGIARAQGISHRALGVDALINLMEDKASE